MSEPTEPRASAAVHLAPAFVTRGGAMALHVANRHVERWAPETTAQRTRSLRTLGFVDRLVAPWIESAQRSASLRMFTQYSREGANERAPNDVSWVFPRPWYRDELDWMAAARTVGSQAEPAGAPRLLTTRGTYVAPAQTQSTIVMPSALYEYVAPSLSIARADRVDPMGAPMSPMAASDPTTTYSPLVSLAAVHAAAMMARAVAPLIGAAATPRIMPGLRNVLTAMLERAAQPQQPELSRLALAAPELVTPPAPRGSAQRGEPIEALGLEAQRRGELQTRSELIEGVEAKRRGDSIELAERAQEHHARVVELQRITRQAVVIASTPASRTEVTRSDAPVTREVPRSDAPVTREVPRTTPRLHEQARIEAAVQAREQLAQASLAPVAPQAGAALRPPASTVPPEVTAAIAALPPELAQLLGPRDAMRSRSMMTEVRAALQSVELMARSAATGAAFEPTRGPRLVMPSGLGGLVSTVEHVAQLQPARLIEQLGSQLGSSPIAADGSAVAAADAPRAPRMREPMRVPMSWLTAPGSPVAARRALTTTPAMGALAATTHTTPLAFQHVAWADRWLARFAGATPQSLEVLTAGGMQSLAAAAPGVVFVAPSFDGAPITRAEAIARAGHAMVEDRPGSAPSSGQARRPAVIAPAATAAVAPTIEATASAPLATPTPLDRPLPRLIDQGPTERLQRIDDNAETPDDLFAEISAAASRKRAASTPSTSTRTPSPITSVTTAPVVAAGPVVAASPAMASHADVLAHSLPAAPGAGLSAQLASSPFAPALRHVMPLGAAPAFDVRALFGGELSATYLAGLLGSATSEFAVSHSARVAPAWARWTSTIDGTATVGDEATPREVPSWDPAYVSPRAGDVAATTSELAEVAVVQPTEAIAAQPWIAPLTTLRSALLSWETAAAPFDARIAEAPVVTTAFSTSSITASTARAMLESMSLPMLGEPAAATGPTNVLARSPDLAAEPSHQQLAGLPSVTAWTSPGMLAERAHTWSVAQERSAADLAFDFVTPELILAARVYGLGPAEAAQAARLAIAGPNQLSAMAGTVDRTFVQAMAIEADRRGRGLTAYPLSMGAQSSATGAPIQAVSVEAIVAVTRAAGAPMSHVIEQLVASGQPVPVEQLVQLAIAGQLPMAQLAQLGIAVPGGAEPPSARRSAETSARATAQRSELTMLAAHAGTSFGVDRKTPRGAFLWPSATVAALGLNAAAPDGQQSMSVAVLELLAAQGVAELGTYAALVDAQSIESGGHASHALGAIEAATSTSPSSAVMTAAAHREPAEADVLATASALVPAARRARFDALYLSLTESPAGRTWSPSARAARALALAGRGDPTTITARERAATAWDVLPVVYANESEGAQPSSGMPVVAERAGRRTDGGRIDRTVPPSSDFTPTVDRPGLGALSARAGEALGSYVTPQPAALARESTREVGAVLRPPTAAPELVRTGRPTSGRFGGGEVEIPSWFEAAAKRMFDTQSSGGTSEGISLADLTLVTAAPPAQIAASTRGAPSAAPATPATGSATAPQTGGVDVEQLAQDIYREIMIMMDDARARNGEPFL